MHNKSRNINAEELFPRSAAPSLSSDILNNRFSARLKVTKRLQQDSRDAHEEGDLDVRVRRVDFESLSSLRNFQRQDKCCGSLIVKTDISLGYQESVNLIRAGKTDAGLLILSGNLISIEKWQRASFDRGLSRVRKRSEQSGSP